MLATDLHNKSIANKITKEQVTSLMAVLTTWFWFTFFFLQWAKNLHNLNDDKDFPREFLSAIYDRISLSPLKLGADSTTRPQQDSILTPKQRQILFHQVFRDHLIYILVFDNLFSLPNLGDCIYGEEKSRDSSREIAK